jgi:transcription initiation factor TFIIB
MASTTDKRNMIVQHELKHVADTLELNDEIRTEAIEIYNRASKKGLIRGRSIEVVISASIYAAIRKANLPQTLDDIAKASVPNKKAIGRMYRLLVKELDLKAKPMQPKDYLYKFCEDLRLKDKTVKDADLILKEAIGLGVLSGRNPMSVVAASLYLAAKQNKEKVTQRSVSMLTGITEATIRNRYKELERRLHEKNT